MSNRDTRYQHCSCDFVRGALTNPSNFHRFAIEKGADLTGFSFFFLDREDEPAYFRVFACECRKDDCDGALRNHWLIEGKAENQDLEGTCKFHLQLKSTHDGMLIGTMQFDSFGKL